MFGGGLKTVYFICVNYNNSHFTKLALESLKARPTSVGPFNIVAIVVDNASSADDYASLQVICEGQGDVKLIRSEVNLGYFGGLNLGLDAIATSRKADDIVIIGNNDLTFPSKFFERLVDASYAEDVFVVAPNVITADGYNQNPHCPARVSAKRKFLYDIYFSHFWLGRLMSKLSAMLKSAKGGRVNDLAQVSQYIHMGIGACYLLTASYFKSFSRLDDSVFLYGEEALLAGQIMSAGGKMFYDSELIVNHAESATLSKLPSRTTYEYAKVSYPRYRQFL
jgi:GT2 family glycosyltransferase